MELIFDIIIILIIIVIIGVIIHRAFPRVFPWIWQNTYHRVHNAPANHHGPTGGHGMPLWQMLLIAIGIFALTCILGGWDTWVKVWDTIHKYPLWFAVGLPVIGLCESMYRKNHQAEWRFTEAFISLVLLVIVITGWWNEPPKQSTATTKSKSALNWPWNRQPKAEVIIVADSKKEKVLRDLGVYNFVSIEDIKKYCEATEKRVTLDPGEIYPITSKPGHNRYYFKEDGSRACKIKFINTDGTNGLQNPNHTYDQAFTVNMQSIEEEPTTFIIIDYVVEQPNISFTASK